jgi:hypothetical protein
LLLTVTREGVGLFGSTYVVKDVPTEAVLGVLEPTASEWNVLDGFRRKIGSVEEDEGRAGYFCYRLVIGGSDVCRFTWGMHGLGVWTSEMDVEFLPNAKRPLDRSLAIAFAPLLEARSRRTSQRIHS